MDCIYQLQQVRKAYDGRGVLDIEDLNIHKGEILAIVGPSGAGKTTLLRILNFLEKPDEGQIHFNNQALSNQDVPVEIKRKITTVFQRPALLSTSVFNNIAFGLRLRGRRDFKPAIQAAMDRMGLSERQHDFSHNLSGGEAQRVALARAMVIEPEVLLLDEPTANLDPYNVGLIESVVRELNQTKGTTAVLVTHNVFQAKRLADRIGLMLNGSIIELCSKETFFTNPQDERTLAFVNGEMVY